MSAIGVAVAGDAKERTQSIVAVFGMTYWSVLALETLVTGVLTFSLKQSVCTQ